MNEQPEQIKTKTEIHNEAYHRAVSGRGQEEIQMKDFAEDYGEDNVKKDQEYVREKEKLFREESSPEKQEAKRYATILEAIVTEQVELADWLGPSVTTRKASRYDDIRNGVDTIVEIEEERSHTHLAIALDVTHGEHLDKKFRRIKTEIEQGELATVKYFESDTMRGRLKNIPRIILGVNRDTISELSRLWVEDRKQELAYHPVQLQIIDEIHEQLEEYRDYAERLGKDDLVRIYDRQLRIIESIELEKEALKKELFPDDEDGYYQTEDRVYQAIHRSAQRFSSYVGK